MTGMTLIERGITGLEFETKQSSLGQSVQEKSGKTPRTIFQAKHTI
jgi:hypothetical protein